MDSGIHLNAVSRVFVSGGEQIHAVRDVTLQVPAGGRVAIVGPSGSGKTTLLNLIGALDRPSDGYIHVFGQPVHQLSEKDAAAFRKTYVGFVFQDDALIPELTVAENTALPLVLNGVSAGERRTRVQRLLSRLGLGHRTGAFPPTLSGGEKQRVAVARAIIHKPRLVLADEPTANLDAEAAAAVTNTLLDLSKELGITVLLSTHDPRVFDRFQRVVRLADGCVAADTTGK